MSDDTSEISANGALLSIDIAYWRTKVSKMKAYVMGRARSNHRFSQCLNGKEAGIYKRGCPPAEEAATPPVLPTEALVQEKTSRSSVPGA